VKACAATFLLLLSTNGASPCAARAAVEMVERVATVDPGFPVRKLAMAPDGSALAAAGADGATALVRFSDGAVLRATTQVAAPVWLGYAPDGSEVWVIGRAGAFSRLDPRTDKVLPGATWDTRSAGVHITSPAPGHYVLRSAGTRVEVQGRIVTGRDGRLDPGGAVHVAVRPDHLVRFHKGDLRGDPHVRPAPVGAMATACSGTCLLTAASPDARETFLWSLVPFGTVPKRLPGTVFLDIDEATLDASGSWGLLSADTGLRRIALPRQRAPDGAERDMPLLRGRAIAFAPNDRYLVTLEDRIDIFRLSPP
jgi:hypothetical protein